MTITVSNRRPLVPRSRRTPVDFRGQHNGLVAHVKTVLRKDPFTGRIFVFRAKRSDCLKLVYWDGTGLVMVYKRLEEQGFAWPAIRDGVMTLSHAQFEALFSRLDWRRVRALSVRAPTEARNSRTAPPGAQPNAARHRNASRCRDGCGPRRNGTREPSSPSSSATFPVPSPPSGRFWNGAKGRAARTNRQSEITPTGRLLRFRFGWLLSMRFRWPLRLRIAR